MCLAIFLEANQTRIHLRFQYYIKTPETDSLVQVQNFNTKLLVAVTCRFTIKYFSLKKELTFLFPINNPPSKSLKEIIIIKNKKLKEQCDFLASLFLSSSSGCRPTPGE